MGMIAELNFLGPLFDIADEAQGEDKRGQIYVTLRGIEVGSSMARDDSKADLDRYRVSDIIHPKPDRSSWSML